MPVVNAVQTSQWGDSHQDTEHRWLLWSLRWREVCIVSWACSILHRAGSKWPTSTWEERQCYWAVVSTGFCRSYHWKVTAVAELSCPQYLTLSHIFYSLCSYRFVWQSHAGIVLRWVTIHKYMIEIFDLSGISNILRWYLLVPGTRHSVGHPSSSMVGTMNIGWQADALDAFVSTNFTEKKSVCKNMVFWPSDLEWS